MLEVVRSHSHLKQKIGRPSKLSLENQLLMTLEYWREYRTYFHIGQSWGVKESTAYTRISHKAKEKRSQKLPKCLLQMNFSSFKYDPSENRLYTGTVQI